MSPDFAPRPPGTKPRLAENVRPAAREPSGWTPAWGRTKQSRLPGPETGASPPPRHATSCGALVPGVCARGTKAQWAPWGSACAVESDLAPSLSVPPAAQAHPCPSRAQASSFPFTRTSRTSGPLTRGLCGFSTCPACVGWGVLRTAGSTLRPGLHPHRPGAPAHRPPKPEAGAKSGGGGTRGRPLPRSLRGREVRLERTDGWSAQMQMASCPPGATLSLC